MDPELYAKVDIAYTTSLELLSKYIPLLKWQNVEDETAVDIGCGTSITTWEILRPLLPAGVRLIGADFDPNMLQFAAKKYPELKTFELDITTDNLHENLRDSFDHVFSFYTLMRVGNITQALQNIYDMLKPGGQFFGYYPGSHVLFDMLFKLSVTEKWKNYMPDMKKIFHYFEFDEINVSGVQKMYTDIGFKLEICKVEFTKFKSSSIEELKTFLVGVSPGYSTLPPNLKEEFVNDAIEMLFQHKIWKEENHDYSKGILVPYNLIIIHAKK